MPAQTSIDNPLPVMLVSGGVAVTTTTQTPVAPGTATATGGVLLAAEYRSTKPTFTNTQQGSLQLSSRGSLITNIVGTDGTSGAGVQTPADSTSAQGSLNVTNQGQLYNGSNFDLIRSGGVTGMQGVIEQASATGGATYLNVVAGQATTVVKASAGKLYRIIFNSVPAATGTLTIYDHASGAGTIIGKYTAPAAPAAGPVVLDYGPAGINCATGITLITATANSADMTVVYK